MINKGTLVFYDLGASGPSDQQSRTKTLLNWAKTNSE